MAYYGRRVTFIDSKLSPTSSEAEIQDGPKPNGEWFMDSMNSLADSSGDDSHSSPSSAESICIHDGVVGPFLASRCSSTSFPASHPARFTTGSFPVYPERKITPRRPLI